MSANVNQPRHRAADRLDAGRTHSAGNLRLTERVSLLRDRLEARADARAAAGLQADVREARGHVRGWEPGKAVSADTASRYAGVVARMQASGERPEDARCKSSFEFRRAAVVHEARASIKQGLTDLDRARRAGDINRAADAYNLVREGLDTLRRYPPSTGSREADLQRSSSFKGPLQADPDRSNGKRGSLAGLPAGWRDKIQSEARDYDRPGLAVMALTGCRPAEVRGAKVHQNDGSITIEIRGAKVDDSRGIKTRAISLEKSELDQSQSGRDLQDWLGNRETRTIKIEGTTEAFRERVSRAADRADLDQVSSYTYRHAEARELKNSGESKEEIANRLGHRSGRSQSVYG